MARNTKALKTAKILRQKMTLAERRLWAKLRDKGLGVMFRRQAPFVFGIYNYVVDFYCPAKKLIIELDGEIHNNPNEKSMDEFREEIFIDEGYQIIRFKNQEVLYRIEDVLKTIQKIVNVIK